MGERSNAKWQRAHEDEQVELSVRTGCRTNQEVQAKTGLEELRVYYSLQRLRQAERIRFERRGPKPGCWVVVTAQIGRFP